MMGLSGKSTRGFLLTLLLMLVFLVACGWCSAAQNQKRLVRVGYYPMSNFQEYDSATGQYRGYSYDYMLALAQYAGWKYEFVPVSYAEGLRMLADGRLDLMNNVQATEAVSGKYALSAIPSGESCTCLVVPEKNKSVAFEDFSAIGKLTVGFDFMNAMNGGFIDFAKDNNCMPRLVYYHTEDGVRQGLQSGEIGACLVSNLEDTSMRVVAKFNTQSYHFATTKGNADLLRELNAAMNALKTSDPYFAEKLYAKYHGRSPRQQTVVSPAEKVYVATHPVVKVAFDPAWAPLSYRREDGTPAGALVNIFKLISARTGLQFEYVSGKTPAESLAMFRKGEAQVMAGFPYDYTWAVRNNAQVTTPFAELTLLAAYHTGQGLGPAAALPEDSYARYLNGQIRKSPLRFETFATTESCLDAVLEGKADQTFIDSFQLEYYGQRAKYRDLSFTVVNGDSYSLSIAVANTADPRLFSIISRALASIGSEAFGNLFREAALEANSHSLFDILYTHPSTAKLLYVLLGFLAAVVASSSLYAGWVHRKNGQLRAATSAKSEFLSNLSHDMRTPLNGIIGYTDLALEAETPEQATEYLRKIRISGHLLLNLINDTLDISKIERGKFTLHPEIVDGRELLEGIIVPIRQAAEDKGIHFIVSVEGRRDRAIRIDRLNIQKVILNLLSNAVKFTPDGGTVRFEIHFIDPPEDGLNTLLVVSDTGIGIGEAFLPRLFEPFTQEHRSESGNIVGTGLGLSIVKEIVTLMGGKIHVDSEKGRGTRFEVRLPVEYVNDPVPAGAVPAEKGDTLRGCRALLCEDNAINREIAVATLKRFGMAAVCAADGREGVELFAASKPGTFDVILMDIRMPEMNGYEATQAIRSLSHPDAAGIPIVGMSADAYAEDIHRCMDAGMNGHVAKPVDRNLLFRELVKHCRGGRA